MAPSTLPADNVNSPAPLATARARHRRYELPCNADLTALLNYLDGTDAMRRDRRHQDARAYPDVEAWLDHLTLRGRGASPRTLYVYERQTAPLLRRHLDKTLGEFTTDDIRRELVQIPPRSRHISRSIYNSFFDWAVWDERIEKSPMARVEQMSAPHRRPKEIFDEVEVGLLLALPHPDGALFAILFGTGIRGGEARALRRSHVDLTRGRLMVHGGKGNKDRVVPFTPDVTAAISDLDLLERLEPDDYLWHRARYPVGDKRRRNDPIGSTTFATWYANMVERAGVRYFNPHTTRHTYAWWIRQGGLDLEERQELLGHTSPETTIRQYGRIDMEDLAAKVAAL